MNIRWIFGRVPASEKLCRTILLYKEKGERTDVGNWPPLTIGNAIIRLYAKIIDNRIRHLMKLNPRQKAFVPVDGCFENVAILQETVSSSWRSKKETNVVFLDLAKAFDTVRHASIQRALGRQGLDPHIISRLLDLYAEASTTASVGTASTRSININSGVKQGCPLSPTLFNAIMDELICTVECRHQDRAGKSRNHGLRGRPRPPYRFHP
jgi:hypothetical protein